MAEAGQRVGVGTHLEVVQRLRGRERAADVRREQLEEADVVRLERVGGRVHQHHEAVGANEREHHCRLHARGAERLVPGEPEPARPTDGEGRGGGGDPIADPLELLGAEIAQRRGVRSARGRDLEPGGTVESDQGGLHLTDVAGRGQPSLKHGACRAQARQAGRVAREALGSRLAGQAAERVDAPCECGGAIGQKGNDLVIERLDRLDVDGTDRTAVHEHRHAGLGAHLGHRLEVVVGAGDLRQHGRLARGERPADHARLGRHPVEDLPVAAHGLAAEPPAALEVERGEQGPLRAQVRDHGLTRLLDRARCEQARAQLGVVRRNRRVQLHR